MKSQENSNQAEVTEATPVKIGSIVFSTEQTTQVGKPVGSVRENGNLVFSKVASALLTAAFYRAGQSEGSTDGKIYLLGSAEKVEGAIRTAKNGDQLQFRSNDILKKYGAAPKTKYSVAVENIEGQDVVALTPLLGKDAKDAEGEVKPDTAEAK